MKKIILIFGLLLLMLSCNKDDDKPEPIIEEEPDLSFPECLLSDDVVEYHLIMDNPPSEPRGHILKSKYNDVVYYTYNVFSVTDVNVNFYTNNCDVYCTFYVFEGMDCTQDFWNNREQIGIVWTDPR